MYLVVCLVVPIQHFLTSLQSIAGAQLLIDFIPASNLISLAETISVLLLVRCTVLSTSATDEKSLLDFHIFFFVHLFYRGIAYYNTLSFRWFCINLPCITNRLFFDNLFVGYFTTYKFWHGFLYHRIIGFNNIVFASSVTILWSLIVPILFFVSAASVSNYLV